MTPDQILPILLSIVGALSVAIATIVAKFLDRLATSVEDLNQNMAVVVKQVDSHDKRLERLENDKER